MMWKAGVGAGMALGVLGGAAAAQAGDCLSPRPQGRPARLLFVGNSYTYFHDMPKLVEAIARANGAAIETGLVASGGATLHDHVATGDAVQALRSGRWDYVVLQEQSGFGDTFLVDGRFRIRPTTGWMADARALAEAARGAGARPVLLAHWSSREAPEDQPMVDALYADAARRIGACLIRTGPARGLAERRLGRRRLYVEDGSHPTALASYVVAATVAREIAGRPLAGAPATVTGEAIAEDDGARLGKVETLVDLPAALARQAVGWANAGHAEAIASVRAMPGPPAQPSLPAHGRRPTAAALAGAWRGTVKLYPVPTSLELTFGGGSPLNVDVRIRADKGEERVVQAAAAELTPGGVRFDFAKGPGGAIVHFEGVYDGRGSLSGLARFRAADGRLEGVGRWRATRAAAGAPIS